MNPLQNPLDGFSPEFYLATLSEVAHSDGLHPIEEELLLQQAEHFGLDLESLPKVPQDLSTIPWATRVLVFRDALTLAYADHEELSDEETEYLGDLKGRLALPEKVTNDIERWVKAYEGLLDDLLELLNESG